MLARARSHAPSIEGGAGEQLSVAVRRPHRDIQLRRISAALPLAALPAAAAGAQARPAPRAVTYTSIFAPLVLPTPNEFRVGSGAPGVRYWQNRADYTLRITLDTASTSVRSEMVLRYTNSSPDTLRFLWLQTEQNALRSKSLNSFISPEDSRFSARGTLSRASSSDSARSQPRAARRS